MFSYKKNKIHFLRWFRKIIYLWIKSKVFPKKTKKNIPLDPKKSICYVLKSKSLLDLLVLDYHCIKEGLPRPLFNLSQLSENICASFIYMKKQAVTDTELTLKDYDELYKLLQIEQEDKTQVQIVPVSIFWGRNPGRSEKSLLKLLFFDDDNRGFLQRFFTFFIHGRNVCCCFGQSLDLHSVLENDEESIHKKSQKIHRLLRMHFHEKRIAVLGPYVYNRNQVMRAIIQSDQVEEAIQREIKYKKIKEEKAKKNALKYLDEIAAQVSHNMLKFLDITLNWALKRLYRRVNIYNFEPIRHLAEQHEIVYLPCHRSHMDYLLLNHNLLNLGVTVPHTAAGLNMNFWPMGPVFRGGGGFFIRRSFNGNHLYKTVFSEYLKYLMTHRYSMCFYLEGGRSRTGNLLDPKLGLLSMIMEYSKTCERKVYLVPIYIGYDKMLDGLSYLKELRGSKKQSESFGQLVKARKVLKKNAGEAYLNFGNPIELKNSLHTDQNVKSATKKIAHKVMCNINEACVVSPISIFSLALFATPNRALGEEDLISLVKQWYVILKHIPYSSCSVIADENVKRSLEYTEQLCSISRFSHQGGDVLYINEKDAELLNYYKNNITHLFLIPSMIASFFEPYDSIQEHDLISSCSHLYQFVQKDYFLKWDPSEISSVIKKYLDTLIKLELLVLDKKTSAISKPALFTSQYSYLIILGNIIGPTLKQYCLFSSMLYQFNLQQNLTVQDYEKECSLTAQKLSILGKLTEQHTFNHKWYTKFINFLTTNKYIRLENNIIHCELKLEDISKSTMKFLGPNISQSIVKSTSRNNEKTTQ